MRVFSISQSHAQHTLITAIMSVFFGVFSSRSLLYVGSVSIAPGWLGVPGGGEGGLEGEKCTFLIDSSLGYFPFAWGLYLFYFTSVVWDFSSLFFPAFLLGYCAIFIHSLLHKHTFPHTHIGRLVMLVFLLHPKGGFSYPHFFFFFQVLYSPSSGGRIGRSKLVRRTR